MSAAKYCNRHELDVIVDLSRQVRGWFVLWVRLLYSWRLTISDPSEILNRDVFYISLLSIISHSRFQSFF